MVFVDWGNLIQQLAFIQEKAFMKVPKSDFNVPSERLLAQRRSTPEKEIDGVHWLVKVIKWWVFIKRI